MTTVNQSAPRELSPCELSQVAGGVAEALEGFILSEGFVLSESVAPIVSTDGFILSE